MTKTLVEAYADRLSAAEKVLGINMSREKKVFTARILNTVNRRLTEALDNSVGTNRSDMGAYKVFCLNMANVVAPSLIAPEILLDVPMDSIVGNIVYNEYVAGSNKGNVGIGSVFNTPFDLPQQGNADGNYTASLVTSNIASAVTTYSLRWTPVVPGTVHIQDGTTTTTHYLDDGIGGFKTYTGVAAVERTTGLDGKMAYVFLNASGQPIVGTTTADATVTYGKTRDANAITGNAAAGTNVGDVFGTITMAITAGSKLEYSYNNAYVPQNDLPILNVRKNRIAVEAKVRRIAINYAQLAAYQNSTDYGEDLQSELTKQAVGQLKYDIDVEAVKTLLDLAQQAGAEAGEIAGVGSNKLEWSRTQPIGVSLQEHYASFAQVLAQASQAIYDRTRKFMANFAVVASDILPILDLVPGFQKASTNNINGPFYAGNVNGLKVYVTPSYKKGQFVVGLNAGRLEGSAAALCMYMPIAPTQLLGFADGTMSQGFSTAYDIVGLNKWLVVEGQVTGTSNTYWAQNSGSLSVAMPGNTSDTPFYNQVISG